MDSDNIYAPRPNTATRAGIQRIPVTTASAGTSLSPELAKTGWVSVKAIGGNVDFVIAEAGGILVKDASGFGTNVGYTLTDGQERDFFIALTGAVGVVTAIGSAACNLLVTRTGKDRTQNPST